MTGPGGGSPTGCRGSGPAVGGHCQEGALFKVPAGTLEQNELIIDRAADVTV